MCCMTCGLKAFKSLYVHANTYLNSLNNSMNADFSAGVQSTPKFTVWGLDYVPRFTVSYFICELLVLQLGTYLNLS